MGKFFWNLKMRVLNWWAERRARKMVRNMLIRDCAIQPASGETLDRWGEVLGNGRLPDEEDKDYRARLHGMLIKGRRWLNE